MGCVSLLRLDLTGGLAPGNKHFKLQGNLSLAREGGLSRILSFGGPWSNHLHALAALGYEQGFETIGIVRGEGASTPSAMLVDARDWGMQLVHVSRTDYRQRNEPEYLESLQNRFGPCLIVPEGGANRAGVEGCRDISTLITAGEDVIDRVVLPVGTGTTLAGLVLGLPKATEVLGISVLKGAEYLDNNVGELLRSQDRDDSENWRIAHDFHCGGYAKVSPGLREFMDEFERVHGVQLDPVYTAKMMFAIHWMVEEGDGGSQIVAVHTGGLQGRRGFSWLG